ncbi:filamentous hemagglutinin family outer membrane protein (plasmid) [Trichormus variabilis NIES-23]|uniref:Filamentous hemagglutinin family outer membrane protein n=1 Tax=Trichormus variabilis NIES-23 TaxID=1973479 RepID=A0A1Z4KWN2_ANAVA|nr:filamentous hemagglutinin family outer membrane protein [Trichormus variabilis NIES-23]
MKSKILPIWIISSFIFGVLTSNSRVQAQIIPDATLPVNSSVTPGCKVCTITGGTERGVNLYHSFQQFSIPTGGEAYFNNALQIQNILTRVTGSSLSNIDGLIRANGIANLYLLNPNGIVFGPNASLNIGGSFVGTTAGSLKFPDGSEYSAINPQAPSLLAVNLVPGVQFGARSPGSTITNAGNLAVTQGQSLTLLGGTTTSTGTLTAPGGTVQVLGDRVALLENALVDVSSPTAGGTALIGGDYKGQGTVPNAQSTEVGANVVIKADALTNGNGGKVIVWADGDTRFGGTITAQGGFQGGNGGFVETSGKNNLTVGNTANVNTLTLQGQTGTWLLDPADLTIVGNGTGTGTITDGINSPAGNTINNTAIVAALNNNNVTLSADNSINVNASVNAISNKNLTLQARIINIVNNGLSLDGGGSIVLDTTTNGLTQGTSVSIDGGSVRTQPSTPTANQSSRGGDITIKTENLTLKNVGQVNTFVLQLLNTSSLNKEPGERIAGDINITAHKVTITGSTTNPNGITGIFSTLGNGAETGYNSATGRGGNISINKGNSPSGSLTIEGTPNSDGRANAVIAAKTFGFGDAGSIDITTGDLIIKNDGSIDNSTTHAGNAGEIKVTANSINLSNDNKGSSTTPARRAIQSVVQSFNFNGLGCAMNFCAAQGNGGDVNITTNSLEISNAAISTEMQVGTTGLNGLPGKAGDIHIQSMDASGTIRLTNGAQLISSASGIGDGGRISISGDAGDVAFSKLTVNSNANLQTQVNTGGNGKAGDINIGTSNAVSFDNAKAFSTIENGAFGNGGNIDIKTNSFSLSNKAALNSNSSGMGSPGSINIAPVSTADRGTSVTLESESQILSSTEAGGESKTPGNITIKTGILNVNTGANLQTIVRGADAPRNLLAGQGNAGAITIVADNSATFDNASAFSTIENGATGNGGNIDIKTGILKIQGGGQLQTLVRGADANNNKPPGRGNAGNVKITATGAVFFNGNSKADSNVGTGVNGTAGGIDVTAATLSLTDGAQFTVNSGGTGAGGNIKIKVPGRITLNNAKLTAETTSTADGGNIIIDPDILLLRNGSQISTSAGTQESVGGNGGGNGGNITIDSTFIVSAPLENNDIFANAFGGRGGVVKINASNLYWIDILSRENLGRRLGTSDPTRLLPNNSRTNDITAFSQTDPTANGAVTVNALNLDVTQGLGELNLLPIDSSSLIAQGCATGKRFTLNENKFVVTGRSGIPASPEDIFRSDRVLTELGTPTITNNLANSPATPGTITPHTSPHPMIEAQGWIVAPNGKIRLVAQTTNPTASNLQQTSLTCPAASSLNP